MGSTIWRSSVPAFEPTAAFVDEEILAVAARSPGRMAMSDATGQRKLTFGQLDDGARRLTAGLAEHGLGRGDVVGIVAANHPAYAVALCGALRAGAAVANANPGLTASELRRQLQLTRAKLVIADAHSIAAVTDALVQLGSDAHVYMLDDQEGAPPLSSLLRSPKEAHPSRNPSDIGLLFPSGGTTGLPKISAHAHAGVTAWLQAFARAPSVHLFPADTLAVTAPFTHMFGSGLMSHALRSGAKVVSSSGLGSELDSFLRMLADHRVTVTSATPPLALALSSHPLVDRFDLSSLRLVIVSAAPCSPAVQDDLEARLGCQVADCLGATEAWCYAPAADPVVRGSVGAPAANVEAVVVDPDTGEHVGPDEPGELWIRAPQVMVGYVGDQRATAEVLDSDGWLHTGDLCSVDGAGNIYILDRLKELIKVGGCSVAPAEVERELLSHAAVVDAAVVGRPDAELGEVPVAYVSLRADIEPAELLGAWLHARLAPWKLPHDVIVIDHVPRTPAGKLARRNLIERERQAQARPTR